MKGSFAHFVLSAAICLGGGLLTVAGHPPEPSRAALRMAVSTAPLPLSISTPAITGPAAFSQTPPIQVRHPLPSGLFGRPTRIPTFPGARPWGLALADFTSDGAMDLVTANSGSMTAQLTLFRGSTIGGFVTDGHYYMGEPDSPRDITVTNTNSCSDQQQYGSPQRDVMTTNPFNAGHSVCYPYGNGQGAFPAYDCDDLGGGSAPHSVISADFNNDGIDDRAATRNTDGSLYVLLGDCRNGNVGSSSPPVGPNQRGLSAADFDLDCDIDIAVAYSNQLLILENRGPGPLLGSFIPGAQYSVPQEAHAVVTGDFNADNRPDVAVTDPISGSFTLLLGQGNGSFIAQSPVVVLPGATAAAVEDFTGDGLADVALAHATLNAVTILEGYGGGGFTVVQVIGGMLQPKDLVAGDFDKDGDVDIALSELAGDDVAVLLNRADIRREVLSPLFGQVQVAVAGQCSGTAWCFNQHMSLVLSGSSTIGHGTGGGISKSDDTYAWDINRPTNENQPVFAVAPGIVAATFGGCSPNPNPNYGAVLIEHQAGNGAKWWSGYLHMDMTGVTLGPGQVVGTSTVLGQVSNIGAPGSGQHLHFAVYRGSNTFAGLVSFNARVLPR